MIDKLKFLLYVEIEEELNHKGLIYVFSLNKNGALKFLLCAKFEEELNHKDLLCVILPHYIKDNSVL